MVPLTNIKIDEWYDITEQCLQILIEKKTVYRRKYDTLFASMCLPITHLTGRNPDEYATD